MYDEKIETELRVKSCTIKPFDYSRPGAEQMPTGEVLEIRAEGMWHPKDFDFISKESPSYPCYPVSLHFTVYPGCGVVPVIGDYIQIAIERLKH